MDSKELENIELTMEEQFAVITKGRKEKHYTLVHKRAIDFIKNGFEAITAHNQASKEIPFDDVVLTEEEEELWINEAKEEKFYQKKTNDYFKMLNGPKDKKADVSEEKYYSYVINELFKLVGKYEAKKENIDKIIFDQNKEIFMQLFQYFVKSEKAKLDPNKGIFLFGIVGCGKTCLMEAFQANLRSNYAVVPCRTVAADYEKDKYEGIEKYFLPTNSSYFKGKTTGWEFDDLGTEGTRKSFGNSLNVMEEVASHVYDNKRKGLLTFDQYHMTSNLSLGEIEEYYGSRFISRVHESYNLLKFPVNALDLRKIK